MLLFQLKFNLVVVSVNSISRLFKDLALSYTIGIISFFGDILVLQ